ncbi:MAG: hypothetical protein AAF738_07430 [Bacteroidota bacterium]
MIQQTIQLAEQEARFLNAYANHGFNSIDQLISKALHLLKKDLEHQQQLLQSADIYAEVYEEDEETQSWTEAATLDWE